MRFSFGKIWAAAVCLLVFASCAKDTSESYAGIEQRSLDARAAAIALVGWNYLL